MSISRSVMSLPQDCLGFPICYLHSLTESEFSVLLIPLRYQTCPRVSVKTRKIKNVKLFLQDFCKQRWFQFSPQNNPNQFQLLQILKFDSIITHPTQFFLLFNILCFLMTCTFKFSLLKHLLLPVPVTIEPSQKIFCMKQKRVSVYMSYLLTSSNFCIRY